MSANPSTASFDELLEQLKSKLPEPLFATVSKKFLALQYAELKIQVLEERLRLKRIEKYGPGSEKLTNEQLELLELEPGVSTAEVRAESAREPVPARPAEKRVGQHPGRQSLPAELPRVERVIAVHAGTMHLRGLRQANRGDRPRRERAVGCRAGEVFRGGDQAREAGVQELRRAWRAGGAAAAAHHREEFGKRPHRD